MGTLTHPVKAETPKAGPTQERASAGLPGGTAPELLEGRGREGRWPAAGGRACVPGQGRGTLGPRSRLGQAAPPAPLGPQDALTTRHGPGRRGKRRAKAELGSLIWRVRHADGSGSAGGVCGGAGIFYSSRRREAVGPPPGQPKPREVPPRMCPCQGQLNPEGEPPPRSMPCSSLRGQGRHPGDTPGRGCRRLSGRPAYRPPHSPGVPPHPAIPAPTPPGQGRERPPPQGGGQTSAPFVKGRITVSRQCRQRPWVGDAATRTPASPGAGWHVAWESPGRGYLSAPGAEGLLSVSCDR